MNEDDSRPRARTVFEAVVERQGGNPDEDQESSVVERPIDRRRALVRNAASRELDRFAALTGVLATHLTTSAVMWPLLLVIIKIIVSAVLFSSSSLVHFTWLQAMALAGGVWIAGPVGFFLYRYWSGNF